MEGTAKLWSLVCLELESNAIRNILTQQFLIGFHVYQKWTNGHFIFEIKTLFKPLYITVQKLEPTQIDFISAKMSNKYKLFLFQPITYIQKRLDIK